MDMPDASALHMVGSMFLAGTFDNDRPWYDADMCAFALGYLWELKDGLIPYERAGLLGGEGFSWGDLQCDLIGVMTHRLGVLAWNRIKYHKWQLSDMKQKRTGMVWYFGRQKMECVFSWEFL